MTQRPFPYLQSVYFSLTMFIDHFSVFFPLSCAWSVIFLCVKYLILPILALLGIPFFTALLVRLSLILLLMLFTYHLLLTSSALYKREPISYTLFYESPSLLLHFFYVRVFYLLGVFLGLMLAFVPGLFVATHYYFSGFSLLTRETTSFNQDAQQAINLSQGCQWQLLFAYLMKTSLYGLFFLYFFQFGFFIPLFLMPITALIDVHLYYALKASSQDFV